MKKVILWSIVALICSLAANASEGERPKKKQINDTTTYTEVSAKIIDKATEEPIVFASVSQTDKNVGTVSNADGEFILKIPGENPQGTITITHLGYKNKEVDISALKGGNTVISLETHAIPIEEIVVKKIDPEELILKAISLKQENYPTSPEMQTGFYRETIKQNRNYVSVSEAVLDIYNSGYRDNFDFDRVKIFKGRKSKDVKRMDTILVKFQGGPRTAMFMDLVKNPGVILDPEIFPYYEYKLGGIVKVNDRNNYIVEFDQRNTSDYPLYQGKIYIDTETYAITSIDFKISEKSLNSAAKMLIKKKPARMKMDVEKGNYRVNYREINGKWVLNYVRAEVEFKIKWDRKLFKTKIHTMFEMAITDRDTENVERFPYKVSVKYNDVLADEVASFTDEDFWGEYNYIKPDESIEIAIKKLNRRLQRQ
jgi:hypothetical protein